MRCCDCRGGRIGTLTEIVGGEGRIAELSADFVKVFIGATDEEDSFEMHELFRGDVIDHINEEYFLLQDLSP